MGSEGRGEGRSDGGGERVEVGEEGGRMTREKGGVTEGKRSGEGEGKEGGGRRYPPRLEPIRDYNAKISSLAISGLDGVPPL